MIRAHYQEWQGSFAAHHLNFWSNLSRFNNLMVIMNISLFFLTGLVAQGYYYTFYSLICLGIVGIGSLIPTIRVRQLWYYWIFLAIEMLALYYWTASVIYWVGRLPN